MNAYSKDLRLKVIAAVDHGTPKRRRCAPSVSSWRLSNGGSSAAARGAYHLEPKPLPGRTPRILANVEERRVLWASSTERRGDSGAPLRAVGRGAWHEGAGVDYDPGSAKARLYLPKKVLAASKQEDEEARSACTGVPESAKCLYRSA